MMRAVTLRTENEELALRDTLWTTILVTRRLKSLEVSAWVYFRLVTGEQIDDGLGRESGDCGAADVLKRKGWEACISNKLCEPSGFSVKYLSPRGVVSFSWTMPRCNPIDDVSFVILS